MKTALIFAIGAIAAAGAWTWSAKSTDPADPAPSPQVSSGEPACELCVSPGSRASLLMAQQPNLPAPISPNTAAQTDRKNLNLINAICLRTLGAPMGQIVSVAYVAYWINKRADKKLGQVGFGLEQADRHE